MAYIVSGSESYLSGKSKKQAAGGGGEGKGKGQRKGEGKDMRRTRENAAPEALGNTSPAAWLKVYVAESGKQTVGLQQKALSNTKV